MVEVKQILVTVFVLLMGIPFLAYVNQLPRERGGERERGGRERERERVRERYFLSRSVALLSRVGLRPEGLISGQEG
jgi:hypothetical protein